MSCPSGKLRYRDALGAELALAKLQNEDKPGHTERRKYRCPLCYGYHLTSQRPPRKRRKRRRKSGRPRVEG